MSFNYFLFRVVSCTIVCSMLWSCEPDKLLDIDYFNSESKLVVFGNFEADSSLQLSVYYSDKLSHYPYPVGEYKLSNAKLELYNSEMLLETRDSFIWYESVNKLSAGIDYRVKIYHEGYDTVYANFSSPPKVRIDSVTVLPYSDTNYLKVQLWFQDAVEELNGYGIRVQVLQQKIYIWDYMYDPPREDSNIVDYFVDFVNVDPLLSNLPQINMEMLFDNQETEPVSVFNFKDEKIDGENYGLVLLLERNVINDLGVYVDYADTLCFELMHINEGYYKFLEKSRSQLFDLNNSFVQPQNIPSNIENGYGYIGGYTTDYFKVAVRDLMNETKTK